MIASFVFYCGLFLAPLWGVYAPVLIASALLWPVDEQHAVGAETNLDRAMPRWQFSEHHEMHIAAPPQRVFESIRPVTANEIFLFQTLIAIRRLGRPLPPGILHAPADEPLLDVATRTSFRYVAIEPPKEIVVETIIIRPRAAIAAMNFLVTPDGRGGSILSTETRVVANSASALLRFRTYWRVILPGSQIIRVMWLRAIRKRAEAPATGGAATNGQHLAG